MKLNWEFFASLRRYFEYFDYCLKYRQNAEQRFAQEVLGCFSTKAQHRLHCTIIQGEDPKNLDRILRCCEGKKTTSHGAFSDAPWRIGQHSVEGRAKLHVEFPLSTFNFQSHSLFRLSVCHADLLLS